MRAAAAPNELAAYESIRRRRYFRHWIERDGAVRVDGRFTPDAGAALITAVDATCDEIVREARRAGTRESSAAFGADALVALATDQRGERPKAMVHVVVDERGGCEIPGIGPIPRATGQMLASDAIVKAVVKQGSDIRAVAHLGRTIPAKVRTALEVRDPVCVVPGCDVRRRLEIDHYRIAFADGGRSSLDNLARLCPWHHYQKTHLGYRLSGRPGGWQWETPGDLEGARPPPDP